MVDISLWINIFLQKLEGEFGERVCFAGLQGSYARGEATSSSDIDVVVIFDKLTCVDINVYNALLDSMPHRELVCGFVSGKSELVSWEPADLFQFYHDTVPLKGNLDYLLSLIGDEAVNRAIKIGVCNIYHGCVHNMLHKKSDDILIALYKSASFVVQAICFRQTGKYFSRLAELSQHVSPEEKKIIDTFVALKKGGSVEFHKMSELLFVWSGDLIKK